MSPLKVHIVTGKEGAKLWFFMWEIPQESWLYFYFILFLYFFLVYIQIIVES